MHIESLGGNRYFFLLVDNFSRITWIRFLQSKGQTFETFLKFQAQVERETGNKIKIIPSDIGGEFLSKEFNEHCEKLEIQRELSPPYTPQYNGTVERKNRVVVEKIRCLLKCSGLPVVFWAEAAATAVHLINISPTEAIPNSTPYE